MNRKPLKLALAISALVGIAVVCAVMFENQRTIEAQRRIIDSYRSAGPLAYDDVEELNEIMKREFDAQFAEFSKCEKKLLRMVEKYRLNDLKKALGDPDFSRELYAICAGDAAQEPKESE